MKLFIVVICYFLSFFVGNCDPLSIKDSKRNSDSTINNGQFSRRIPDGKERKSYTTEQIIGHLQQGEVLLAQRKNPNNRFDATSAATI